MADCTLPNRTTSTSPALYNSMGERSKPNGGALVAWNLRASNLAAVPIGRGFWLNRLNGKAASNVL